VGGFLELGISWKWVVSFTSLPLYPQEKSPWYPLALVESDWSASRPCRFIHRERAHGTHWIGGWVGPRGGLDDMEKWKFLILPGLEPRPLGRPARSQSLYRLRYRGSIIVITYKSNAISVTPWRPVGLWDVKDLTLLGNGLTDGSKVVRPVHRSRFTPQKHFSDFDTHFW
jgi:hypothetical protein